MYCFYLISSSEVDGGGVGGWGTALILLLLLIQTIMIHHLLRLQENFMPTDVLFYLIIRSLHTFP